MKKWRWFLILLVLSLALASCDAGETPAETPVSTFPVITEVVEDGITPLPTSDTSGPGGEIITGEEPPEAIPPVDIPQGQVIDAPLTLSSLFVMDVAGQNGGVGEVDGIVFDALNGQMQYLAMSNTGPAPDRTVLLPLGTFYIISFPDGAETEGIKPAPMVWLTVDAEYLAEAPGFDAATLEDSDQVTPDWDSEVRTYWADIAPEMPVTGGEEGQKAVSPVFIEETITDRIDFPAVDRDGELIGIIEDLVFDQQGRALFLFLRPDSLLGLENEWIPVAWRAFSWMPEEQEFVLQVSTDMLENAPQLNPDELPDTTLPGWESEWLEYWEGAGPDPVRTPVPENGPASLLLTDLQKQSVTGGKDQQLGQLADWIVDAQGISHFAVLQLEEEYLPVPAQLLNLQPQEQEDLELVQDPSALDTAPSFASLEELQEPEGWLEPTVEYWSDYTELSETGGADSLVLVRTGSLLGKTIVSADSGNPMGEAVDAIIDAEGEVTYLVVKTEDRMVPVPWINFEVTGDEEEIIYLDDMDRFNEAPGFSEEEPLDPSQPGWDNQIRSYWGLE